MSFNNEDVIPVPWVGPLSSKNTLTIVVLSETVEIIEKLVYALTEVHSKGTFDWKLAVLQSIYLEEVVIQSELTGRIAIDFVIVAVDTGRMFCLDWTKKQVSQIDPDLRSRRVVLVNAGALPMNAMAGNLGKLMTFKNENKLDLITGDVMNPKDAVFLARRLFKYMEVSIGVKTGYPNLNV